MKKGRLNLLDSLYYCVNLLIYRLAAKAGSASSVQTKKNAPLSAESKVNRSAVTDVFHQTLSAVAMHIAPCRPGAG